MAPRTPVALTPGRPVALRRPAVRRRARPPVRRPRDPPRRAAAPRPRPQRARRDRPRRLGRRGPGARLRAGLRRGAAPVAGRDDARLGRVGPPGACPGTRPASGSPRSGADGTLGEARTIAGGAATISVVQPAWSARRRPPRGLGRDGLVEPVRVRRPGRASTGRRATSRRWTPSSASPPGSFGAPTYAFLARRRDPRRRPRRRAGHAPPHRARTARVGGSRPPFTEVDGPHGAGDGAIAIVGEPARRRGRSCGSTGGRRGRPACSPAPCRSPIDPAYLPEPSRSPSPTSGGATARALYFAPTNPASAAPDGERPPLIVLSHGGPTGAATSALSLDRAFFTSRGIAVVDVDYRGSTGYGRPYRDALNGQWGVVDVDDCVAAARFLVGRGDVDPRRLVIRGGSAGGYTTLAALAFQPEVFAAGHQPLRDRRPRAHPPRRPQVRVALRRGPARPVDPTAASVFRDRSPIHHLDRMRAPMLLFQGLDDKVVPPSQLDVMEAAFARSAACPTSRSVRGRGPRLPARSRPGGRPTRRSSRSSARSSASRRLTLEPVDMPGSTWTRSHARRRGRRLRAAGVLSPRPSSPVTRARLETHEHPRRRPSTCSRRSRSPKATPTRCATRSRTPSSTHPRATTRTPASPARRRRRRASCSCSARSRPTTVRRVPERRPRHRPRHRLHAGRLRLRLPDLRHDRVGQGAVAGHRPGRRRGPRGPRRRVGDELGAGDQGMMFGFACRETPELMPLPIALAHRMARRLAEVRKIGPAAVPAAGRQDPGHGRVRPRRARSRVRTVVVSAQQDPDVRRDRLRDDIIEAVILPVIPRELRAVDPVMHVNPTGRFVIGGPMGDAGPDRPQDHRRHVRRDGPPRRRRVQRQGPDEGRPLGGLRGALGGEERGRGGARGPVRARGRVRDRHRASRCRCRRLVRDRDDLRRADPGARRAPLRPPPGARSSRRSTCAGRSTARPRRTATSAATDLDLPWERTDKAADLAADAGLPEPELAAAPLSVAPRRRRQRAAAVLRHDRGHAADLPAGAVPPRAPAEQRAGRRAAPPASAAASSTRPRWSAGSRPGAIWPKMNSGSVCDPGPDTNCVIT